MGGRRLGAGLPCLDIDFRMSFRARRVRDFPLFIEDLHIICVIFKKIDVERKITTIAQVTENIDGIEPLANGDFILTSWVGYIYYVSKQGGVQTLLETHQEKINTADIGIDIKNNIVYVPTFFGKKIIAFRVEAIK